MQEIALTCIIEKEVCMQRKVCQCVKFFKQTQTEITDSLTFKSIDVSDEGFIDIEKLDVFLRRVGYSSSESELIGIIRRMDKNGDMTITFKEWQDYF